MSAMVEEHPIQIKKPQNNSSLEQSYIGKIFIKNLEKNIDEQFIHDTFSAFGTILGFKVARDETGSSKGYAIVHFETEEAANESINKVNGTLLNGEKVHVGRCVPLQKRKSRTVRSANQPKPTKRSKTQDIDIETMDKENSNPDDKIDKFLTYLSEVLRRLPEEARRRLQIEILNVLEQYVPSSQDSENF